MSNGSEHERRITQWAAIVGQWTFNEAGTATYLRPQTGQRPFGLCVSNIRFSEGKVRVTFCQSNGIVDGRILIGYKSPQDEYLVIGLGGYGDAYTITHFNPIVGWQRIAGAGRNESLLNGKKYEILVRVEARRIVLEVDGICVLDHTLETELPYGQIGLLSWGETGSAEFSNASVTSQPSDIDHVLILVHGIRTHAEWQSVLRQEFSRVGIVVVPTNYGYFDLVRFILPIPWFRASASQRVWDLVRSVKLDYPKARISFLSHSFGTYIVGQILRTQFDFKAHRIVFCGSVLRYSFPFEQIRDRFTAPLVNEVSARDPWPVIAQNITFGYGSVGARGFNRPPVRDRWHRGFGHSQYLTQTFCRAFWIPFFENGEIVEGATVPEKAPWWCRLLQFFTKKGFLATFVIGMLVLWPYVWITAEPLPPNQSICATFRSSAAQQWRANYLLEDRPNTYYVIVRSISQFRDFPLINSAVANLNAYQLRRRFPEIDFDTMFTSAPEGGNRMHAVVLARAITDKSKACEISNFAQACGIADDAYTYRLNHGPEAC